VLGVEEYANQLYSSLPKGAIIARFGVGHDGVDKQKATEAGIIVTNTPGVLDDSVAEHAIWLMGTLARSIPSQNSLMKSKNWQPQIGNELKGKTLLIVGCGAIGRKVAKIASFGLGMKVLGYDVADLDTKRMKNDFGIEMLEGQIEEEICKADYISIHLPSIDATRNYVNSRFLSHMKNTAYLINTARGAVLDERALYDTLKSGQIAGAALDVFETEPYKPINSDKDLRTLDNIILTPHIGSSAVEACQRMAKRCLFNIKAAFEKRYDELDIINPQVLEKL
jgi:lactate dehydrogenase-like 2-hydroxyacid dehydrogenase